MLQPQADPEYLFPHVRPSPLQTPLLVTKHNKQLILLCTLRTFSYLQNKCLQQDIHGICVPWVE